ncbi:protein-L-isoaspartate O-methyltransferase [Brevundimonas sp. 2R-24]|uniref:Protein-L-isoaspartate O-methyltransferase n=1 Tax=Peiella sedimenti TaxID=3061083 RepID=A0ABT8SMC7_9CAUL|nr:protein-L-isoaspartate O-methyltransferase [Caulobacteraceae bacterium XZ-24]
MDFVSARLNMVDSQVRTADVTDTAIHRAMRTVHRERLVPADRAFAAYSDREVPIGPGRVLLAPRDLGKLLQAMAPQSGEKALAIAAPYAAAVLAEMGLSVTAQEPDGHVPGFARGPLSEAGVAITEAPLNQPAGQGFDLIIVEGAVSETPQAWIDALGEGGRLGVVERNGPVGKARLFLKTAHGVSHRELFDATPQTLAGFEKRPTFQL